MLKIHESGAVGDVIGWFIDAEGKVIDTPMNERMMSPAPEVVKTDTGKDQRLRG